MRSEVLALGQRAAYRWARHSPESIGPASRRPPRMGTRWPTTLLSSGKPLRGVTRQCYYHFLLLPTYVVLLLMYHMNKNPDEAHRESNATDQRTLMMRCRHPVGVFVDDVVDIQSRQLRVLLQYLAGRQLFRSDFPRRVARLCCVVLDHLVNV